MRFKLLLGLCLCALSLFGFAREPIWPLHNSSAVQTSPWVENQLSKMTLDQKIAQLLVVQVYSNGSAKSAKSNVDRIRKYQPGGVCFFDGGPVRQLNLLGRLQKASHIPLLVSIDGEWGPAMRLDSCLQFPRLLTLGALPDSDFPLIEQMGAAIGRQCRTVGVHVNFAPCVDVNCNPLNPVINSRSFGELPGRVAEMSAAFIRGMQGEGVSACAKHFPGHGDTRVDSHQDLPVINKSLEQLEKTEFVPFGRSVDAGVDFVMVGHLRVSAMDTSAHSIASLSYPVVTDFLLNRFAFKGLVITDALGMKGVRNQYPHDGSAEVQALLAGVDLLLMPSDLDIVIPAIRKAVNDGVVPESVIDYHCRKVLLYKEQRGLLTPDTVSPANVYAELHRAEDNALVDSIEAESITLLRNRENILPLSPKDVSNTLLLCIGDQSDSAFYRQLAQQRGLAYYHTPRAIKSRICDEVQTQIDSFSTIIVNILGTNQLVNSHYGVQSETLSFLQHALQGKRVVLLMMGNPYALNQFSQLNDYQSVVVGYTAKKRVTASALRCLFGERDFTGRLPVSVGEFPALSGLQLPVVRVPMESRYQCYLNYSALPDHTNYRIDSMVLRCIDNQVMPGCQILAMQRDRLLFYKNYGKLTYDGTDSVTSETMYDVASMTKALSTTLAVMKLYDEGRISLSDRISKYLSFTNSTRVGKLTLAELLTHTTGLPPGILFYKQLIANKQWKEEWVQPIRDSIYYVQAADGMFLRKDFPDTALQMIAKCHFTDKKYVYSDLNFILLKEMVERVSGQSLDEYVRENFYEPLGLVRTGYNPLTFASEDDIAPTENDTYFRYQLLRGYVHDPSAAVFGGVSGNAGLFSTAQEVSVILRMLMHGGELDGVRYLSKETVEKFVTVCPMHGCERRGLGFDMPSGGKPVGTIPAMASARTYGHQGFTGTVFWCDPENDLLYVFLSNRVCPKAEPNNLSKSRLRLLVHDEIYRAIQP